MQLAPKLQPFWFTPEFQDEEPHVRFRLKPLTQEQMIEVESLYEDGSWTRTAQFRAGMLSIVGCENIFDPEGRPVRWPHGIDDSPGAGLRLLICHCGMRIIVEMNGGDWGEIMGQATKATPTQPAEADPAKT